MEITEAQKLLIENNPISISTATDNIPNIAVAAFAKIKDNQIILTNNYMKTTINNIKINPKISLAVWDKNWQGYKISGIAQYSEEKKWIDFIKSIEENKGEPCKGAIIIKSEKINTIG